MDIVDGSSMAVCSSMEDCSCLNAWLPCSLSFWGNFFLIVVYGLCLSQGAKYLADGSEILLDYLDPGFIGGFIVPLLGALPDAAIIVVSGTSGPREVIDEQINIGVGTLTGSTIMLLTICYAGCLWFGRCDLDPNTGEAIDKTLTRKWDFFNTGVSVNSDVKVNARFMVLFCIPYLLVEGIHLVDFTERDPIKRENFEDDFIFVAFVITAFFFTFYSFYMVISTNMQMKRISIARKKHLLDNLAHQFVQEITRETFDVDEDEAGQPTNISNNNDDEIEIGSGKSKPNIDESSSSTSTIPLLDHGDYSKSKVDERITSNQLSIRDYDRVLRQDTITHDIHTLIGNWKARVEEVNAEEKLKNQEESKEEKKKRQIRIIGKSIIYLTVGTVLVVVFSDPMVKSINVFSEKIGISPFYISFVFTPFVSNASELIASLIFSAKKTRTNITMAFSAIYGAVTMNSTLNLGIFLFLIWAKNIVWVFSAEVFICVCVILIIGVHSSLRHTMKTIHAVGVLLMFPFSLLIIYLLRRINFT